MRLARIKLAGFKSFVDPTDIKLPSALVGIIGPNGCGKSNTIDAVRWVMGESSAKHLRGESMDDVIFTGSSSRKPVGQASVELVFDNSDGSLGGEYAGYAEIALKREVTRDGQSRYLLNNTRCRRRDIRDIFYGTGLGPRSYAIVEQGMVSRLIEAKPEELRVYLEEAAGISKYKERRRETENRIRHTRDNLDRLNDLREEVDKQIAHLKRQADTAARYQQLKADERRLRGELLCLRRSAYAETGREQAADIARQETALQHAIAELRAAEAAIEQARVQHEAASDAFSRAQSESYRIGAEVSRVEQQIEFNRKTRQRQQGELGDVYRSLEDTSTHRDEDTARIADIDSSLASDQPAYEQLADSQRHSASVLAQAERALAEWRERYDDFTRRRSDVSRTAQVERTRVEQLERNLRAADERLERLGGEFADLDTAPLLAAIDAGIAEEAAASETESRLAGSLARIRQDLQQIRTRLSQAETRLHEGREALQGALGRQSALVALQQAALESGSESTDRWLTDAGLARQPRLAQVIRTEPGWETAVTMVIGPFLDAVCAEDGAALERCLADLPDANLALITGNETRHTDEAVLAAKFSGPAALLELASGVRVATDLQSAFSIRQALVGGESVITAEGVWLGRTWLRLARASDSDNILSREAELVEIREHIARLRERNDAEQQAVGELGRQREETEVRRETAQHALNDAVRELAAVKSLLRGNRQSLEQAEHRRRRLDEELHDVRQLREQDATDRELADRARTAALAELAQFERQEGVLVDEQTELEAAAARAREQAAADRDAGQALAIRVESLKSARTATEQNLARMLARIVELDARRAALESALAEADDAALETLKSTLAGLLDDRLAVEAALASAREELEHVQQRLRAHEQARVRHDSRAQTLREELQAMQLASQESLVRLKTIDEQLAEHDYRLADIDASLAADASIDTWSALLEKTEQRIQRLGPINLAAIDEHAEQLERREYLDRQHADVSEALATLEQAIARIDRETRARFRDTYEQINEKFTAFFPRLFGGGRAALELTGDELLSAGVSVLAQPPGKRISSIQLLSGGEKALTAVALVFAFFELNPSPFCMLDEVDAPLDDANVGRFCALVKEMSERVQFIFITHNKVTMEMADQLMGVTMNEPGVSRLVAVDVQEAVELAGA